MANSDRIEWRLIDTDLVTQIGIIPHITGSLYFELNEPGSGKIDLPLDATIASSMTSGRFCMAYYRGSARGGFFIDNVKKDEVGEGEGEQRLLHVSGRGPLALLDDVIVWTDGTTDTTRLFENYTKAGILAQLFDERFDRGSWPQFDWDFSATHDSDAVAWTDNENLSLTVGMTLLDVLRQFAATGEMEFEINIVGALWTLSAYQAGIGSDKTDTVYFRVGFNCEEVGYDERGDKIENALLVKYQDGYTFVSDSTSITNRRRRERLLSLNTAQSSESASTFAAAKLDQTKDPTQSTTVKVFDGVDPNVYIDYELGDTVTLDKSGTQSEIRILGVQLEFRGVDYSSVTVEMGDLIYENDLEVNSKLDWLLDQWNSAHDANLTEVKEWMSIGAPNDTVNDIYNDGTYLYVGGEFTQIGNLSANFIARYEIATGLWSTLGSGPSASVMKITKIGTDIYTIGADLVSKWGGASWSTIGTANLAQLLALATDGTDLYVGGAFTSISGVGAASKVWKWNGSAWSAVGTVAHDATEALHFWNSVLYWGGDPSGSDKTVQKLVAGNWVNIISGTLANRCYALGSTDDNLVILHGTSASTVSLWDGAASSVTNIGTLTGLSGSGANAVIATNLSDIYIGAGFTTVSGVTGFGHIARYSGGLWTNLANGVDGDPGNDYVKAIAIVGDDVYAGGFFTTPQSYLAVYVTSFDSLVSHLSTDNQFDMGAAIHAAPASAISDSDEIPFWEDGVNGLRKILWLTIKSTLKTYFDTFYATIADLFAHIAGGTHVTNGNSHDHNGGDGGTVAHTSLSSIGTNTHAQIDTHLANTSNPHSTTAAQVAAIPNDGWVVGTGTWSYSSADSPTFVISINADVTAILQAGMRIKLTQTTVKYFIITVVGSFSGGATLVTVYGGTDYTLANAAISSPYYSPAKAPFGFPLAPTKWTVITTDTSNRSQATPTQNTWYNLGSISIVIPIGEWNMIVQSSLSVQSNAAQTAANAFITLSTANNSESDKGFTGAINNGGASGTLLAIGMIVKMKVLSLAAKTTYYLNARTTLANMAVIDIFGSSVGDTTIRAVCAYL